VRAWLTQHTRALGASAAKLLRAPVATLFNVAVLGIALALPAILHVALVNLQQAGRAAAPEPQLTVFMDLAASRAEVREVEARLRKHTAVARVRYVPREQALEDVNRLSGLGNIADTLGQNPLPDAFIVDARDRAPTVLARLRDELSRWPKVGFVQLDAQWAQRLAAVVGLARLALLLVGTLLAFALVAVTFNTIRLQILSQREEIEVASLIGATPRYIRRPFLYYGAVLGLLGGLAAWGVVWATTEALNGALHDLAALYGTSWTIRPLPARDAAALLGFSAALGWLGAWLCVSRHLASAFTR
jgi:cell division transport system permease protein